jgi:hypothetical protein
MKCKIMEIRDPQSGGRDVAQMGYLDFPEIPTGVILIDNTLCQIHGYRWEAPKPSNDPDKAPEPMAVIFIVRQSNLVKAPAAALDKNGGLIMPGTINSKH